MKSDSSDSILAEIYVCVQFPNPSPQTYTALGTKKWLGYDLVKLVPEKSKYRSKLYQTKYVQAISVGSIHEGMNDRLTENQKNLINTIYNPSK